VELTFQWSKKVPVKGRISLQFIQFMLNRMCFGYYRYERQPYIGNSLRHQQGTKRMKEKLVMYEKTGNQEFLADIANYCMIEFMSPSHPKAHLDMADQGRHERPTAWFRNRVDQRGTLMDG
jgi:hypothetical protein